jgi:uncharacterized protein (TIGR02678 family)
MNNTARDAARSLLRAPLVVAAVQPDEHRLIRRHADELVTMFRSYLGYRLVVDARLARLYKAGLGEEELRPLVVQTSRARFSPRDYTYLALICAVLLATGQQVLLSMLVADVEQAAAEAGIALGQDTRHERLGFVHALRQLIAWGAISDTDGSISAYADGPSEALLTIERDVIHEILSTPLRDVSSPEELVRVATEVAPEAVRHRVRRRIVECPVVMLADLSEAERTWLRQSQRREAHLLEENLGLRLEIRAEGVAAFDPLEELSDLSFPREGTVAQAALLAVSELVDGVGTPVEPLVPVDRPALEEITRALLDRHAKSWANQYLDRPDRLAADVEELLCDVGLLVRDSNDELWLRAVAARYAPEPTERGTRLESLSMEMT